MKDIALLLGFFLIGCGQVPQAIPAGTRLVFQIQLPGALGRTEKRRDAFIHRVSFLELELQSKGGVEKKFSFPPGEWASLALPEIAFPAFPEDRLSVRAKIWDRRQDGSPRDVPALSGSVQFKAGEMAHSGPTRLPVRLVMRVPVSEYD